jgi:hypothetical protein
MPYPSLALCFRTQIRQGLASRRALSPGLTPQTRADKRSVRLPLGGVMLRSAIPHARAALRRCPAVAQDPTVTPGHLSYVLSGPWTPMRANSVRACRSPSPICGPFPSPLAAERRARLISPPDVGRRGERRNVRPVRFSKDLPAQHPSLSERSERFGRGRPPAGAKRRGRAGGGHPLCFLLQR